MTREGTRHTREGSAADEGVLDGAAGETAAAADSFFRTIVEHASHGLVAVDAGANVVFANPAVEEILGYAPDALVGVPVSELVADRFREQVAAVGSDQRGERSITLAGVREDGREVPLAVSSRRCERGDDPLFVYTLRDISDQVRRERALRTEQAFTESVLDTVPDLFYAFDESGTPLRWNDQLTAVTGYTDEEIAERNLLDFVPAEDERTIAEAVETVLSENRTAWREVSLLTKDGRRIPHEFNGSPIVDETGEVLGVCGIGRDIAERKRKERRLANATEKYRKLIQVAPDAIFIADAETGEILETNRAAEELVGKPREEIRGLNQRELHPPEEAERYRAMFEQHGEEGGIATETGDVHVVHESGERIPVEINATSAKLDDGRVIHAVFRDLRERRAHERRLHRQRDELVRLNRINTVIRDVNRALVGATERAEIERLVCDHLAAADPYMFAWIGEVSAGKRTVAPRASAGVEDGYLDDVTISVGGDETSEGPTGRAIRDRELRVNQGLLDDPDYEPWQEEAYERGYRSSAAIPLVYEGQLYGVLNLYACHEDAFDTRERAVLAELGETIAHAINALERKRALMTDSVVEVELRLPNATALFGSEGAEIDGTLTFERTIPAGEEAYLQYVSVDGITDAQFRTVVATAGNAEAVTRLAERGDRRLFEVRSTEPPLVAALATDGGRVRRATLDDGTFELTAELPDGADVRGVLETVRESFPSIELVAQRRVARRGQTREEYQSTVADALTDKQRAALEAAYFAGYFDRPRTSTGGEVAASLGITASTFHQHLRVGQRKLLAAAFDAADRCDESGT